MKLWIELGRETNSSRSEFGVRLPNDRLLGSLRCRDTDAAEYGGDSRTGNCIDADDRRELTLLDRREETDARLARLAAVLLRPAALPRPAERPLMVPRCLCEIGLEPALPRDVVGCRPRLGSSFRFPLGSSLNHLWNAERRLARLRCPAPTLFREGIVGSEVSVSAGEPVSAGGDCLPPARIQGEPTCP